MSTNTTYKQIQDSMASIMTLNMDAYVMYIQKKISREKLDAIVNITNVCIKKCQSVVMGRET